MHNFPPVPFKYISNSFTHKNCLRKGHVKRNIKTVIINKRCVGINANQCAVIRTHLYSREVVYNGVLCRESQFSAKTVDHKFS